MNLVMRSSPLGIDEERLRRQRVQSILVHLQRYVRGYLPYYRIEAHEDFSKNLAEVTIKVWWTGERDQESLQGER